MERLIDREKIIKELVNLPTTVYDGFYQLRITHDLRDEIVKLLKEQEAVEPKTEPSAKGYWFTCGVCGWWLFEVRDTVHFDGRKRIRYCASCGQAVKWE